MWNDKKIKQEKQAQKATKPQKTSKSQMTQKTTKPQKPSKSQNMQKLQAIVEQKEVWGDYYYMTSSVVEIASICTVLQGQGIVGLEVWPEMGVLEWPTAPERSIDMEVLEPFEDKNDAMFLKKNGIQSIFSLRISNLDEDIFLKYFEEVLKKFGGAVCCDTETFEPTVMGKF